MKIQTNEQLGEICAGLGIGIEFSVSGISLETSTVSITDSDGVNTIMFDQGVTIDNASGGGFSLSTLPGESIKMEITAEYLLFEIPDLSSGGNLPRLNMESIIFCGTPLGSFSVDDIALYGFDFTLETLPKGPGILRTYMGVEAEIGRILHTYNDSGDALSINNIHFSKTSSEAPEDPSSWSFADPFEIGIFDDSNPASIELNNDPIYVQYNLPMSGSIRIENVSMGTSNFGPAAIDGIKMHSFYVRVPGTL